MRFVSRTGVVLLVLVACSGLAAGVSAAPDAPRYGGVFIKNNIYSGPTSLDPMYGLGAANIMIQMNIFDGLVRLDPDRNVVVPDIAERWTHTPDAKTFTFYLRRGVRFHDGSEVTAADFKYQFERVADPENASPLLARLSNVAGVKAFQEKRAREISGISVVDPYTLRITMERPDILLPHALTGLWASAVPRRAVERAGKTFGTTPVGSGPFKFVRWLPGREVVLEANRDYWRRDRAGNRLPYLDGVVIRMIRDMTAVEAEIQAGRMDSAYVRESAYLKYKNHPLFGKYLVEGPEFYTYHIGFNFTAPGAPWRDRRVRQAVNYAVDRQAIVDVVMHGKAYPASGAFPPTAGESRPPLYPYDPEKAKRLLAEAGYPNGFSARIMSGDSATYIPVVEAVIGYLNAVGIKLQYEVVDGASDRARIQDGKFEWYYASFGGEGHPLIFLRRGFHSQFAGPAGNWTRYRNPALDQLLDRAAAARDAASMLRLVHQAEATVVDDAPWIFLSHLKGVLVQQPYVRGLRAVPVDMDWQPLDEVWLAWTPKGR